MRTKTNCFLLTALLVTSTLACGGGPAEPEPPSSTPVNFRGTITSGGTPLSGVQVFLSRDARRSTLTDESGTFSFTGITGSRFIITPSLLNHAFTPSNYELGAQSRNDINFAAAPAAFGSNLYEIATDFTAVDQNGRPVSLYSYFGKVVLIDFSADWCSGCLAEALKAEALYQTYKNQGFEMLTILIDGSPAIWATTYGLTFPVLDDDAETLWGIYGDYYVPLNIILDRNMTIRYKAPDFAESLIIDTIKKYI